MKHFESIKKAIGTNISKVAGWMNIAGSTVYKWIEPCEDPTDSGRPNPVERTEQIIEAGILLQSHPQNKDDLDPFAPLNYLNERFNRVSIEIITDEDVKDPQLLVDEYIKMVKEWGDFASESSMDIKDGVIRKDELERLCKEGMEQVRQTIRFIKVSEINMQSNRFRRG